jgi:putative transcriptional regulator
MHEKNISINKLITDTNTDFKVVKRLMSGELVRIDIFVIARLCDYLNCSLEDLIEYKAN